MRTDRKRHERPRHLELVERLSVGRDDFDRAAVAGKAVEAVKQYKFKPAMENGKPVLVELNVEVNFQIF